MLHHVDSLRITGYNTHAYMHTNYSRPVNYPVTTFNTQMALSSPFKNIENVLKRLTNL